MTFEQLEDLFLRATNQCQSIRVSWLSLWPTQLWCVQICRSWWRRRAKWLALAEEQAEAAENSLEDFYQASLSNLEDISFLFQPLLPDDELPLTERLVAVGDWCSNYISGLGEGMGAEFEVSVDGKEALEDLAAIGQISRRL